MSNSYIKDFPILNSSGSNGKRIVYLDNAATTQKPLQVIKAISEYYNMFNANPHRGAYSLSTKATEVYESSREAVRDFISGNSEKEIIFTKSATESLNLVANTYGLSNLAKDDEILVSIAEHHSNLIPWQILAKKTGAVLKYVYLNKPGEINLEDFKEKLNHRTKIVAISHVSNVLGIINPIKELTESAHEAGAVVVLDATQSIPHFKVDVQELDVDFLGFSGHKLLGPMGIGVLYGKEKLLNSIPPFLYGGGMVDYVSKEKSTFADIPAKFEGGTPNVEGAYGLLKAIEYINNIGYEKIYEIEKDITSYTLQALKSLPYITIYGDTEGKRIGVISFNIEGVHPHDVSTILDSYGVAVRAGHHCAHPLMTYLGINSCCRMSIYFYNTKEDIDIFLEAVKSVRGWLGLESR
jgi:cysteine desulfurase/selenocysteine lyase